MRFGLWGRFPMRFGGGKPRAQRIYEQMRDGRGTHFTADDGGLLNRYLRADARAVARAQSYQSRGALQVCPALATDLLPEWEMRLGITPDRSETRRSRANLIEAVLAGNGPPTSERLAAALTKALDGETGVSIASTVANGNIFDAPFSGAILTGFGEFDGSLRAGTHYVSHAFESDDGHISASADPIYVVFSTAGGSVHLDAVSIPAPYTKVHYYLSVGPESSAMAYVATGSGSPIQLSTYPTTDRRSAIYHYLISVSYATWLNKIKRNRIHTVIGPMIEAWSTYDIVTGSPFLLDTSPLDAGAF